MKFSSSLLEALIGGVVETGDFLPPAIAHVPTNMVERVPMASYGNPLVVLWRCNAEIEGIAGGGFEGDRGTGQTAAGRAYDM